MGTRCGILPNVQSMFIQALVVLVTLAAAHVSQRAKPARIFAYNPAALEQFNEEQRAKLPGANPAESEAISEAKQVRKPGQGPPSYVNISGNFGGVFYVTGVGGATSQSQSNLVNITTNRGLTFSAISFRPLQLANSPESTRGTVTYTMTLYQGSSSHVGSIVAGPVSGTDAGFNGQSLAIGTAQVPSGGNLVLVINRTLTLTGQATGACTLVGTGYIGVTIN